MMVNYLRLPLMNKNPFLDALCAPPCPYALNFTNVAPPVLRFLLHKFYITGAFKQGQFSFMKGVVNRLLFKNSRMII